VLNPFFDKFVFTNGLKFRHNNFFLINLPFFIVPVEVLAGLLDNSDNEFNKKLYYSLKESVKKRFMKQMSREFGLKGEKMIGFLEKFFSASGWGSVKHVDLNFQKTEALVSVSNNPFSSFIKSSKQPVDHLHRAVFAGLFSSAFGKDVECVEVKCSSLGNETCEFVVRPQSMLDLKNPNTRNQVNFNA